jgi:iron complex transport system permease protein
LGSQNIWSWTDSESVRQVLMTRLYSVLVASVVGAALALAGLAFQALLRNPLADPFVLGISSGADASSRTHCS